MNKPTLLLLATLVGGGGTAFAIPATLSIDFRSAGWSGAAGQTSKTVGDTTAKGFGIINILLQTGPRAMTWSGTDGLGVDSFGIDDSELGFKEILDFSFANGAGNSATGAWVTKLFTGEGLFHNVTEQGFVELYDAGNALIKTVNFNGAQPSSANILGDVFVGFGGTYNLSKAKFYAKGNVISDYSVAGFTVPDRGETLLLLGTGLLGLGLVRRRRA